MKRGYLHPLPYHHYFYDNGHFKGIYDYIWYIGIPHVQTHPYLPCQGTVERISLAKCHSSHRFYGHMMNASLVPLRDASLSPCGCTGSSLAIHPRFEKKGLQWLLHVPTKRNLKVVAATMIHCAKFAELLTSHPVPLSPSSTVNWSRGECHVNMRSKVNHYKNSSLL